MKKYSLIKLVFVLSFLCTYQFASSQEKQKDLLEAIKEFNSAFKEGNVAKLSSMIAQDYLHTNSASKPIDKEVWVNYLDKRKKEIETKKLIVHTYEMNEVEVRLYDDMAIVSAKIVTSNTKDGKLTDNHYRVTNIWVLEDEKWKRAGFHDGKIK